MGGEKEMMRGEGACLSLTRPYKSTQVQNTHVNGLPKNEISVISY